MRWPLAVAALLLLAGCADPTLLDPIDDEPPAPVITAGTLAVVAGIDTGINPYHVEFRDPSPIAFQHPSTYIPGYPEDALALELTFDAEDYASAVLADCPVWRNVTAGQLYWIPGTRIVGAITFSPGRTACEEGTLPGAILDRGGHGTMITSRVAGSESSICPMCRIVSVQSFSDRSMVWASQQPWIDAQTNSWGDLPISVAQPILGGLAGNDRSEVVAAAARHAVFVAGGNGLAGFFGVTGHPAYFDNIAGSGGIIMVGGHDNGYFTPWTMTLPHVVADANAHPAAVHNEIERRNERGGGGTSGATPFAAGTFMRMVYEARVAVNDTGVGVRDGAIVVAGPNATLPASGPLADGRLTLEEAKLVFYHTARPRPVQDGHWDGPKCQGAACVTGGLGLYATVPVEWSTFANPLPLYYYVGYGQVGNLTLQDHVDAVLGVRPAPPRTVEDAFFLADDQARRAIDRIG